MKQAHHNFAIKSLVCPKPKIISNSDKNKEKQLFLTVVVTDTVCSASFSQQGAEPGCVQAAQPEAPEAEGAVVEVQTQAAQQLDDRGSIAPLHAHSQSPAEVLLMGASAEQELHQLEGSASLTHLKEK